jgi:glycine/D-amino acid oxidase-like deaminating enzyme
MGRRIPPLQGAQLIDSYAALYDVTPDWTPYFGPRAGLDGYYDACGGSGNSFKTGPVLARELVDWMIDDTVAVDFRQLSYDRIGEGNLFKQAFGGNRG